MARILARGKRYICVRPPPCAHFRAHKISILDISGPFWVEHKMLTNELGTLWVVQFVLETSDFTNVCYGLQT